MTHKQPHHHRPTVSLARICDPYGCCRAMDLYIEAIVCKRTSARGMIIEGPIGAGKRQVARAAAAEFGIPVTEIEPNSLVSRDELHSVLARVGADGLLVIHNFDELPNAAKVDLCLLITTGYPLDRQNPYSGSVAACAVGTESAQPEMVIATTNNLSAMPYQMVQALQRFTLRRHRQSIGASLKLSMARAKIGCVPETLEALVNLVFLSASDRFGAVEAMLIAQAHRCDGGIVDAAAGAGLVGDAWATMPNSEIAQALRTLATERELTDPNFAELAAELGVREVQCAEVARCAKQRGRDGTDRSDCPREWLERLSEQ